MNDGITYRDMEDRKCKAAAFDKAIDYLESHADNEASITALGILHAGLATIEAGGRE